MGVLGGETVGVLIHVQRADQHRPGIAHARDQPRILAGRRVGGIDPSAGQRDFVGDVEQVLHRVGHACQRRQRLAAGATRIDGGGFLPGAGFRDRGKAVVARIVFADARQRGVQYGHGAALAAGDLAGDVCGGAGHGRNTEADSSSTGSASSTKLAAMS